MSTDPGINWGWPDRSVNNQQHDFRRGREVQRPQWKCIAKPVMYGTVLCVQGKKITMHIRGPAKTVRKIPCIFGCADIDRLSGTGH